MNLTRVPIGILRPSKITISTSNPVSLDSLKFRIMMQVCQDNNQSGDRPTGMECNVEDMLKHHDHMLDMLFN